MYYAYAQSSGTHSHCTETTVSATYGWVALAVSFSRHPDALSRCWRFLLERRTDYFTTIKLMGRDKYNRNVNPTRDFLWDRRCVLYAQLRISTTLFWYIDEISGGGGV